MADLELELQVKKLQEENAKLRKINTVLIERVEAGGSQGANPYSAFEHSVVLAEQVRERTEALHHVLSELKSSHRDLKEANDQAAIANQRVVDAIESISDAFVLFDRERKIVLFNSKFSRVWATTGIDIKTGTTIQDISRLARISGLIDEEYPATNVGSKVYRLNNGRWVQMSERPTQDGGLVILYTDITALKERETADKEFALEQKTLLLQRTVDNLSQGVVLVTPEGRVELWNGRFLDLMDVDVEQVKSYPPFAALMLDNHAILQHALTAAQQGEVLASEQKGRLGQVIEVRTHPMPKGGFVNTYTDITERHRYAESLRQSEQWIRLITDNVPALIAYLDRDLHYRFTNKVYNEWFGKAHDSLNGESIHEVYTDEEFAELEPYIARALSGENVTFEVWQTNAIGEQRYLLKSYVANLDQDQKSDGFFVMIRDITERRRSAEALELSHQLLEERVEERTSALTSLNKQLRSEITERAGVEARLREAKLEADQANLSKTKFLAAVSHDLLQPLNAARLFSGALSEEIKEPKHCSLANSVSNSLDDVESLLRTLVDISKLDAGVVKADVVTFNLQGLFETLSAEFSQLAGAEGLEFRCVNNRSVVRSDSQLLARILRNFLTNAIRYTEKGKLLLGCRRKADSLWIEVWDTGRGIPKEKLSEVFHEFKRLQEDRPGEEKGLGLGLAIVDKISRVLGHQIRVDSIEGRGSVFAVEVPLGDESPMMVTGPHMPIVAEYLTNANVWLIDNDSAICEAMDLLLTGWGCNVVTALSVDDLREKVDFKQDPVDVLIADYHLDNGQNGIDAARVVTKEVTHNLPVLMITANYSKELNQEIRDLDYMLVNKPVKPLKLKTTLIHMLG
ncbi:MULTISPECIES: NahK/ErcS family hybrid sensor histidine kinase/response regulator [unclassified Neptuniibacter]|uniref:hybrid sensor histidine kinase/response regulator n=1 Tax=unclassified Neptuniibacter TaxID=2630693 RepID=UPI000C371881|nr:MULTISPECIES: NahK/ErcS family hybrid sensor histidine kinase/response regulator [unclassified Neptuniibacter]MAY43581.1 hybrid sensor histidine kinase/response regulator [Oceanospirillaceae bacterium]|tara:strand:- start:39159 stop:41729 length:2571 start_codon:yes stop_codon:yes gene_type:complete